MHGMVDTNARKAVVILSDVGLGPGVPAWVDPRVPQGSWVLARTLVSFVSRRGMFRRNDVAGRGRYVPKTLCQSKHMHRACSWLEYNTQSHTTEESGRDQYA
jgi:hypothetical protein